MSHFDYHGYYEDEIRDFYEELSEAEYEEMKRRSQMTNLEKTSLSLKKELRIFDTILNKYNVDSYDEKIMFDSDTSSISGYRKEKVLSEFAKSNYPFKTLQDVCDRKIYLDLLLENVEEELRNLGKE